MSVWSVVMSLFYSLSIICFFFFISLLRVYHLTNLFNELTVDCCFLNWILLLYFYCHLGNSISLGSDLLFVFKLLDIYLNSWFSVFIPFFFNIYSFLGDRAWAGRDRERQREQENLKQAPGSELSSQSLIWGFNSWTVRSWPELKLDAQPTVLPRCPIIIFNICI